MEAFQRKVEEIVGKPTYLVGGCVRDILMGREPHDFDFCTSATPDEVEAAVKADGRHAYTIGKRFGTIGVKVEDAQGVFQMVEVTTFRTETYDKSESRNPTVEYVGNLDHDLSRRDFTINAMAMRNGRLIDNHEGVTDISLSTIAAVGNPRMRFKEDPLRMLRAARFAARFGFYVEESTEAAMTRLAHRIQLVSRERWMQEMDKLLLSDYPVSGLALLARTKVLDFMLPELAMQVGYNQNNPYHNVTLWEHTMRVVSEVPLDIDMRWAALLHDIGKPFCRQEKTPEHSTYIKHDMVGAEMAEGIALRLKWSTARRKKVVSLIRHHMDEDSPLKPYDRVAKREKS